MLPVPIERVGESAFAAVDVGALQARLDELLARHADFFPVEPNTLWWTSRRGDHQFRGTDVPPNLSTVLGHLMAADGEFATLRVGHRRASENYTAHPFYFDSPEWVEVRINRTTSTVRLAACLGDRARADAALDLVIGAFE